jgi:tetratricopeptide (TPR) repeat protein
MALSLVPGFGHIYWGWELAGLCLFTASSVAAFALLNGLFIYVGDGRTALIRLSLFLLLGIFVGSWADILRRVSLRRLEAEASEREQNLREGMVAYVRGDLEAALSRFSSCVSADPLDVEALFRLGMTCSRAGSSRQAVRWLKRALKHDDQEKWRWEAKSELERLSAAGSAPELPLKGQGDRKETVRNKAIDTHPA